MQSSDSESSTSWMYDWSDSDSYEEIPTEKKVCIRRKKKKKRKRIKKKRISPIQRAMRSLACSDVVDVEKVVDALNGKHTFLPRRDCYEQYCDIVAEIPESCVQMSPSAWMSLYSRFWPSRICKELDYLTDYFSPIAYNFKDNSQWGVYIVLDNKNDQIRAILDEIFGDSHVHIILYITYVIRYPFENREQVKDDSDDFLLAGIDDWLLPGPSAFNESNVSQDISISSSANAPDPFQAELSLLDIFGSSKNITSSANDSSFQPDDFSAFISKNCKKDTDPSINSFGTDTSADLDIMSQTQAVRAADLFADFTFPDFESPV